MNQNGKGDKSRITKYKNYWAGYDEINWGSKLTCLNCNYPIDKNHLSKYPDLYMVYSEKEVEHKNCNFL